VRGPAVIGSGSVVRDAYVGPSTAIGERVRLESCEIEHSIVLADSVVEGLEGRIEASLIGRNVKVGKSPALPRAYRLVVGDNAEIAIL
jgi:glucose-1-phosphate thymidylyltransferase